MPLPIDGQHLSDQDRSEFIEQYGGAVDSQFAKSSVMRKHIQVKMVKGTDTLINRRVGKTGIKALVPGVRPDAQPTPFGRVSVTVDTVILARDNRSMLNELQTDFDARSELGKDHGKELGKFFDGVIITMAIKGAQMSAPTGLNGAIGAGKNVVLTTAGDELDPDKMATAIRKILVLMEEEEIETNELVVLVRPTTFEVLEANDKLTSSDFSAGNADYAMGTLYKIKGAPIEKSARIPTAAGTNLLSNTANGSSYDVTATDARAVAVILHPHSLLAGETIPLNSDVWFNREEKQWFIDSFMAFGTSVRRPDCCGVVLKAA